jgi:predicted dinucleotide-binding enzyme
MKFGFIGVGFIGEVLVRKIKAAGYEVKISNSRGPETLQLLAGEIGVTAASIEEAVQDVDVVFVVIPQKSVFDLAKDLFGKIKKGAIVVDVGNYYPVRDGVIDDIENGMTESQWVEKQIGHPVVKVFNSINWRALDALSSPAGATYRIALPISGDDAEAKLVISNLVDQLGFDPYDAGTIAASWRHQPGSPVYCTNVTRDELIEWLPKVDRSALPHRRNLQFELHLELLKKDIETDVKAYGQAMKNALLREKI